MKKIKVDILGSCISRVVLIDGDYTIKGTADERIEVEYFFDKNNIVSCMMPAPFTKEEIESIRPEELYDRNRINSLKQGLTKETVQMILDGEAEYLILDLYALSVSVAVYKNTTFSNCAYEFYRTSLSKKYESQIGEINFMKLPTFIWYPYIDLFFKEIGKKFDKDHIILNRFHSCKKYIDVDGSVKDIPEKYFKPFNGDYRYNDGIRKLEDYIIEKIDPYVIDLSKYFIVDEEYWGNVNGVHYQKIYYKEAFNKFKDIVFSNKSSRVNDKISNIAVSQILSLPMANEEEYLKYFNEIEYPLVSCDILDNICKELMTKEMVKNRKVLSELYLLASDFEEKLSDNSILQEEKIEFLIKNLSKKYIEDYKEFINYVLNFYKNVL